MLSLKLLFSKMTTGALGALGSFVLGSIATAWISGMINYDILPVFYKLRYGESYIMEVYDDVDLSISVNGNKGDALVKSFSLYMPSDGEKIAGRLVRRDDTGKDRSGQDDIFYLSGFRRSDVEVLSWTKVRSPSNSAGIFIGRYDLENASYVGPVIAQTSAGRSSNCVLRQQWAIVGPAKSSNLFPKIIANFFANNSDLAEGVGWKEAYKKIDRNAAIEKIKEYKIKSLSQNNSGQLEKNEKSCG